MASPTGQTGSVPGDAQYADAESARQRIIAIYAHRGLPPPGNIDRQIARILNEGTDYLGTIRNHAEREAREAQARDGGTVDEPAVDDPATGNTVDPPRELNYRELAGNQFPWLTPGLRDMFADEWAETGRPQFALDKIRQSAEYAQVFPGIRRDDGSLRMSEGEYYSEEAGFRVALTEFGFNPAEYEDRFKSLFENEIGAQRLASVLQSSFQRFVEPGSQDTTLVRRMLDSFIGSGSQVDAIEDVRNSSEYQQVFVGNRREDGTLRMDEPEYLAYKRGWQRELTNYGLNPIEFEAVGAFKRSVEGEQSIQEVRDRLEATQQGILDRIPEIQEFYANNYGVEMTPSAVLGMAIDPEIQRSLLERRITASQIGGEAAVQGFVRSLDRAEELARAGLSGQQARQLYSQAGRQVPVLGALARRFNDPQGGLGLREFEEASVMGDADTTLRIERRLADERSSFSRRSDTRADQRGALVGLLPRR